MTGDQRPPQRRCAACRKAADKRALYRLVRTPDGAVRFDPTGKAAGRGAYLCGRAGCIQRARARGGLLVHALGVEDPLPVRAAVEALALAAGAVGLDRIERDSNSRM